MLLGDFGTTWTKLLDTRTGDRTVRPTREVNTQAVDIATGHNSCGRSPLFVNELIALTQGGVARLGQGPWTLVDVGSRDVKVVAVENGRPVRMDWNSSCGALTGFTLELLGRYFALDYSRLEPVEHALPVTCGVLGMERLFDQVASGVPVERAVAGLVRSIASWVHTFIDRPQTFYLSGGMCDNPAFLKSFPPGVVPVPLGRFVLVEGLADSHQH